MRYFFLFAGVVVLGLSSAVVLGENRIEIPEWMEDVRSKEGKSTYLIPVGAKRTTIGSQVVVEAPNEYVARRLYEMERNFQERLNEMEEEQARLRMELKELTGEVEELKSFSQKVEE